MARFNIEFLTKSLMRRVEFNVYIPSLSLQGAIRSEKNYYQNNEKKFPLIILLAGFGDSYRAWQSNTHIEELCDRYQVAACCIGGDNRWYLDLGPMDSWYSFLENDLTDYLYGTFNNLDPKLPLILGGVSMGGYGTLYHSLKENQKYSAAFALSPAVKPDFLDEAKFGSLRELFLENRNNIIPTYLSVGSEDFIIKQSLELDSWLQQNNIGVRYKVVEGFDHSYKLWRLELENVFQFLKEKEII
jgi:putative tributyrin esterase